MLTFTRKTDYALVALAELAAAEAGPVSARELAERSKVPLPLLRNLLKLMARGGLLDSVQGAVGGYRLARAADRISVMDVVRAVDRPVQVARCCPPAADGEDAECALERSCRIKGAVRDLNGRIVRMLEAMSLEDLARVGGPGACACERHRPATAGRCACGDDLELPVTAVTGSRSAT